MEPSDEERAERYVLRTADKKLVCIGKNLWSMSPVLMTHSPNGELFRVMNTKASVRALVDMYARRKTLSSNAENIGVLSLLFHLRLYCSFFLKRIIATPRAYRPFENPLDSECCPRDVLSAFSVICDFPMRRKKYYVRIFSILEDYCCNSNKIDDFQPYMRIVHKIFLRKLDQRAELGIGTLPVGFGKLSVPISIIDVDNRKQTFVFRFNKWVRVRLFGSNFDVDHVSIKEFYLKYDRFVIFSDDRHSVFFKSLRESSAPFLLLDDCEQLLVKHDKVFALTLESPEHGCRSILKWDGSKFKLLISDARVGRRIDFSSEESLLGWVDPACEKIYLLAYHNDSLSLLASFNAASQILHFCFYSRALYTWCDNRDTQKFNTVFFKKTVSKIADIDQATEDVRVMSGKLFKFARGHWHNYKKKAFRPTSSPGRFVAVSDLNLLP